MKKPRITPKNNTPLEHAEQVDVCKWLDYQYPDLLYYANPNGGFRHKRTAAMLKAEGVKAGVPDLFFPSLFFYVEMKRQKGGSVSTDQKTMMMRLEFSGYKCVVCKGFEAAKVAINARIEELK